VKTLESFYSMLQNEPTRAYYGYVCVYVQEYRAATFMSQKHNYVKRQKKMEFNGS